MPTRSAPRNTRPSTGAPSSFEAGSRIELPSLLGPPGAELAIEIAALVLADLSVGATIEVVAATQRLIRWAHGTQMLALAEYDRFQVWSGDPKDRDDPKGVRAKHYGADDLEALSEFADREISCALAIAPVTAGMKLGMAQDLQERLSTVRAAMLAGALDEPKARLIVSATRVLGSVDAAVVEAQIVSRAAAMPYRRLKSELDRLVIAADPATAAERHRRARKERRCTITPTEDGMGVFGATMSADDLVTVWKALDARAWAGRELLGRSQGDDRSIDQRRVDAFVELCAESLDRSLAGRFTIPDGASPSAAALARIRSIVQRRCVVSVHMGADVAMGVSDQPIYLSGYGWAPAAVGRRLLGRNAVMRRMLDDPITGEVLHVSRRTYRPDAEMADAARTRDQVCTFPTCDKPAAECQLDHTRPHPSGRRGASRPGDSHQTSLGGLGSLCDSEHRLKTLGGWGVNRLMDRWEWISPTGKVYTTAQNTYTPRTLAEMATEEQVRADLASVAAGTDDDQIRDRIARRVADTLAFAAAAAAVPAPC